MGLVMADQVRAADANKEKNSARVPSFPFTYSFQRLIGSTETLTDISVPMTSVLISVIHIENMMNHSSFLFIMFPTSFSAV